MLCTRLWMNKAVRLGVFFVLLSTLLTKSAYSGSVSYRVVELGSLGGTSAQASGVNDRNQAVGSSTLPNGDVHAFFWELGVMTDLGTLGGATSHAIRISNQGHIVGSARAPNGDTHAALWERQGDRWMITDLGNVDDLSNITARALTDDGLIIGYATNTVSIVLPLIWTDSRMTLLPELVEGMEFSQSWAVNDLGQITGQSLTSDGIAHLVMWEQTNNEWNVADLGVFGKLSTAGTGINNAGQIAGQYIDEMPVRRSFFYQDGIYEDIGAFGGILMLAQAIDESGRIVGVAWDAESTWHGFLWEEGLLMDLDDLIINGETLRISGAFDINDQGVIAGRATDGAASFAVLLHPLSPGDIDGDGSVGVKDLLILLGDWGPCADCDDCIADLDDDCTVGVKDLLILLGNWG